MEWFFSGLLVAVSAGVTGFTGYLLWRLFHADPAPSDAPTGGGQE